MEREGKSGLAKRSANGFFFPLGLLGLAILLAGSLAAQTAEQPGSSTAAAGDSGSLFGIWMTHAPPPGAKPANFSATDLARGELLLTPEGKAKFSRAKTTFGPHAVSISESNEPTFQCFPPGVPAIYTYLYPVQLVQAPGEVVMLYEYDHQVRHVYTDGRGHPSDVQPTWMGHSIGHMEGDAFVIDTVGFNDKSWLDRFGHPHSDQLHLTERLQRVDKDFLRIDFTIEDPKIYVQPWKSQLFFQRKPSWEMLEYLCTDNLKFMNFDKVLNGPASK